MGRVVPALRVWQTIYSVNLSRADPCFCDEDTLAATVVMARRTLRRRLLLLRQTPGLMLEIPRGREPRTARFRSPVRWATDPLMIWRVSPLIQERLEAFADEFHLGDAWLESAFRKEWAHKRAAENLAYSISCRLAVKRKPAATSRQYGVGRGEGG